MTGTRIDWQTDDYGKVIVPHQIGDCELTRLDMNLERIELTLENGGARALSGARIASPSVITITCEEPKFITMKSDHLQNVISEMYILDRVTIPRLANRALWFRRNV